MNKILLTAFFIFNFLDSSVFARPILPDVEENNIQLFFLSPLKQAKPKNECKNSACKSLLKNINEAQESIDFAIYGINEQDKILNALIRA
ncbi:hypothetical protein IJO12_09410, partial [bacterium]|nr:hypothetical protein [bacterium]